MLRSISLLLLFVVAALSTEVNVVGSVDNVKITAPAGVYVGKAKKFYRIWEVAKSKQNYFPFFLNYLVSVLQGYSIRESTNRRFAFRFLGCSAGLSFQHDVRIFYRNRSRFHPHSSPILRYAATLRTIQRQGVSNTALGMLTAPQLLLKIVFS